MLDLVTWMVAEVARAGYMNGSWSCLIWYHEWVMQLLDLVTWMAHEFAESGDMNGSCKWFMHLLDLVTRIIDKVA